jgi:hypothetical protein
MGNNATGCGGRRIQRKRLLTEQRWAEYTHLSIASACPGAAESTRGAQHRVRRHTRYGRPVQKQALLCNPARNIRYDKYALPARHQKHDGGQWRGRAAPAGPAQAGCRELVIASAHSLFHTAMAIATQAERVEQRAPQKPLQPEGMRHCSPALEARGGFRRILAERSKEEHGID